MTPWRSARVTAEAGITVANVKTLSATASQPQRAHAMPRLCCLELTIRSAPAKSASR